MFTRQIRKQLAKNIERISARRKTLASPASGFVFLLGNPEFYSHLASWRVVIRTPVPPFWIAKIKNIVYVYDYVITQNTDNTVGLITLSSTQIVGHRL
jgi:hypothetical protein